MLARMLGAARLDPHTFEDVEHDSGATLQALLVVVIVSVAGGVGGLLSGEGDIVRGVIFGVIRGVVSWAVWAGVAMLVGTTILKTPNTRADWDRSPEAPDSRRRRRSSASWSLFRLRVPYCRSQSLCGNSRLCS